MSPQTVESPDCAQSCEPPRKLQRRLKEKLGQLRMFSPIAMEAIQLADDPDSSIQEFCCIIQRDAALAINTLSLSNSVLYSPSRPIENLSDAVVRLGFRECRNLILTSCTTSLMRKLPLEQQWIRDLIWQHGFTTAVACGHLNRVLGIGFRGEEFAAGLLHDIGRLLLAVADPAGFVKADDMSFQEDPQLLQREQDELGTDHSQFGAWFALSNGVPSVFVDAIRFHHRPEAAPENRALVALAAAADHMANHLQRCNDAGGYEPESNTAVSHLAELINPAIESRFLEMAEPILMGVADESAKITGLS